jgi:hypothetical protein
MGDEMRERGGEVDRVRLGGVCSVLVDGVRRAEFVRFVGLVVVMGALLVVGFVGVPAGSAQAAEMCPNEASRQGPSVNLPECRVYEQVTPVDKGDAVDIFGSRVAGEGEQVVAIGNQAYVAEDGDAILVKTDGSFAADASASASAYVFSRGVGGWVMNVLAQSIAASQEVGEGEPEFVFDPRDLSAVGFNDEVGTFSELLGGDESAFQRMELVGPVGGPYAPLFSLSGRAALNSEEKVEMVGGSEDLSSVVLEGENHSLAAGAEGQDTGTDALYERIGDGECAPGTSSCRLVDVSGEGRPMVCGAALGQGRYELGFGGAYSAVSSDGSRIFFTAPEPEASGVGCWNPGVSPQENPPELYVREDGSRTVEISVPHEGGVDVGPGGNPLMPAVFVGASSDGSRVFFMTKTDLTQSAVGHAPELYEYNTEPGAGEKPLTLISGGKSGTVEGDVDSVTAISSDGSSVYFSAFGKLAPGASEYSPGGEAFSPVNLYRYDTVTGETTFIVTLNKYDYPGGFGGSTGGWYENELGAGTVHKQGTEYEGLNFEKEWYTTGDGQFLVFGTVLPLTGFDNTHAPGAKCPSNYSGGPHPEGCFELFRYDAGSGGLVCVSCGGVDPVDGAYFARNFFTSAAVGPPRPVSEDGEDVFFESANVLVSQALPGRNHVYEWHGGVISLVSSPSDPGSALFLGSSADGGNVFFVTHAQLSAVDTDQAADVYDARVGGGFVGVVPPACTGTGCQGVPAAPPVFATPASVTFEGVGNFSPSETVVETVPKAKKCKSGLVKKRGKCVKVKKRARRSVRGRK